MPKTLQWLPYAVLAVIAGSLAWPADAVVAEAQSTETPVRVGDEAKLAKALEAITAEGISSDINVLASDEYEGRETPSEGLDNAAQYLARRLEELGFAKGYKDSYLYPYELGHQGLLPGDCKFRIAGGGETFDLKLEEDYAPFSRSLKSTRAQGKVSWFGSGREQDFSEGPAKDRFALVEFTPTATGRNQNRDIDQLVQRAQGAGAVGLIIIPAPETTAEKARLRVKGTLERAKTGRVSYPAGQPRRSRRSRPSFPTLFLTKEAGSRVVEMMGAQDTSSFTSGKPTELKAAASHEYKEEDGKVEVNNVVGLWEGADPKLRREVIILSAHYDHVGWREDGEIHNGADDNGSGTTGLLALAAALKAYGPLQRSVLLIWVSGEEKGLYGSAAWKDDPWLPKGFRPVANLNIDMIGRNAPDKLMITPTKEGRFKQFYNGIVARAEELREQEGFAPLESADMYYNRSDQANFEKLGIPVAFLFTDTHEDYHQVTDVPAKIDIDKIRRVTRLVMRILDTLQEKQLGV